MQCHAAPDWFGNPHRKKDASPAPEAAARPRGGPPTRLWAGRRRRSKLALWCRCAAARRAEQRKRRARQPASTHDRTTMPKKGKKGKKEDPEVVAARLAQEQAEAEARRRHDQEVADKAAWVQEQEDDFSRREAELDKLETDMKAKIEGLDAEVLLRARSSIAAAEARESQRLRWPDCASEARLFVSLSV